MIDQFYDLIFCKVEDITISSYSHEIIYNAMERMWPIRNHFIDLAFVLLTYQEVIDFDRLKNFFEKLATLAQSNRRETKRNIHYEQFCYEIIVYFVALLLKMKRYSVASHFIYSMYFKRGLSYYSDGKYESITVFNAFNKLDEYPTNPKVYLVTERIGLLRAEPAQREDITFEDIQEADGVIYHLMALELRYWCPRTLEGNSSLQVEIFKRQESSSFFEKTKDLYGVNTKEELRIKIDNYIKNREKIAPLDVLTTLAILTDKAINIDMIGIYR